jgi:biopolymer transport protein ExbB
MMRRVMRLAVLLAAIVTASASAPVFAQQTPAPAAPVAAPAQIQTPARAATQPLVLPSAPEVAQSLTPPAGRTTGAMLHDLSPWSMFMSADWVVKAVMIGLAFASVITWTILIAKLIELTTMQRRLTSGLRKISESRSLAEAQLALGDKESVLASLLAAAMREARMSVGLGSDVGIKERAASSFSEIVRAEGRSIRLGMGALATIGATSPFVGLFGTVWGIMNAFIGISKSQTTNLAVVAPGIAEALLATAIGLVAAIPAVIIYNHFARVTKGYMELVSRGSGAAGRLLSRDLDRSHSGVHSRAAE